MKICVKRKIARYLKKESSDFKIHIKWGKILLYKNKFDCTFKHQPIIIIIPKKLIRHAVDRVKTRRLIKNMLIQSEFKDALSNYVFVVLVKRDILQDEYDQLRLELDNVSKEVSNKFD